MRSKRLRLRWTGPGPEGLREAIEPWDQTPYLPDKQTAGVGVDCVRFVCAVMDSLTGRETDPRTLPQDAGLHRPDLARAAMRAIMTSYRPFTRVEGRRVQGGDVLVVGPIEGGPSHAMIVGWEPNTIWHSTTPRVQMTGFTLDDTLKVFKVYRHDWNH